MQKNFFKFYNKTTIVLALTFLLAGLGIRLYDLTDAPFDFNPTRQFRGALNARYLYYQMLSDATEIELDKVDFFRSQQEDLEPLIIEGLMAVTYKIVGAEKIWIARIYSSIFWIIGGWFLFQLARKSGSDGGALFALGFYLFLPFSVQASRSFQPDPLMTMWIILTAYAAYTWAEEKTWTRAIFLGVAGGMAILTKGNAAFYIGMMMLTLVIHEFGLKKSFKDKKTWAIGALMIAPILIHYVFVLGDKFGDYVDRATVRNFGEIFNPRFYILWMDRVEDFLNIALIFIAIIGVFIAKDRLKALLIGLWIGYGIMGLVFHYHITTHDYYHILLPFLVGLSLVPVADAIFEKISKENTFWQISLMIILVLAMAFGIFRARSTLKAEDFQAEVALWEQLGAELPDDGRTSSIVPHFGYQLMYYGWQKTDILLPQGFYSFNPDSFSYLLVLNTRVFDEDPAFKQSIVDNYPVLVDGGYYYIFDLREQIH
ncbi:MAG: phospholipid carrier-dependent glycosyltransferase [Chloroflexi bacterium]|nr:phospholipid carrier-dependent glycosyltransferase [Chloroflexota bacterium]